MNLETHESRSPPTGTGFVEVEPAVPLGAPCALPALPLALVRPPKATRSLPGRGLFEELRGARALVWVFRVPTRAPVRMPG